MATAAVGSTAASAVAYAGAMMQQLPGQLWDSSSPFLRSPLSPLPSVDPQQFERERAIRDEYLSVQRKWQLHQQSVLMHEEAARGRGFPASMLPSLLSEPPLLPFTAFPPSQSSAPSTCFPQRNLYEAGDLGPTQDENTRPVAP